MCLNPQLVKIRARLWSGVNSSLVPCGKCDECQQVLKNAWTFRLIAESETLERVGWWFAFATLTYRDKRLPHLTAPDSVTGELKTIPCFSRGDITKLFTRLRKKLWKIHRKKYPDSETRPQFIAPKWIACGEYGSWTCRPHYHIFMMCPPCYDAKTIHSLVSMYWRKNGFIIPWKTEGGVDRKGRSHKAFRISTVARGAARYAAKYCCKDVAFQELTSTLDVDKKSLEWKRARQFHAQSRSLGKTWLDSVDKSRYMDLLENGYFFSGSKKPSPLPRYLRDKILFEVKYEKDRKSGERVIIRQASSFFVQHRERIYSKKVEATREKILEFLQGTPFGNPTARLGAFAHNIICHYLRCVDADLLAPLFVAYSGVDPLKWWTSDPCEQWFSRFDDTLSKFQAPESVRLPDGFVSQFRAINVLTKLAAWARKDAVEPKVDDVYIRHQMENI